MQDLVDAPRGSSFTEFQAYWEADERFHRLIAESAGNPFLLAAYTALGGHVQRYRFFGARGVTDGDLAIAEHAGILAAFAAGDARQAPLRMEAHIANVKCRVMAESGTRGTRPYPIGA